MIASHFKILIVILFSATLTFNVDVKSQTTASNPFTAKSGNNKRQAISQSSPLLAFTDTANVRFEGLVAGMSLVDSKATSLTKLLYKNLQFLSGKFILFGQQDATSSGYGWKDTSGRSDIKEVTGDYPAFYSWDFMDFTLPGLDTIAGEAKIRKLTIEAYERGGVNSYCWHMFNLLTNKNFYDTTPIVNLMLPNGKLSYKYKYELNKIGKYVQSLKGKKGELIPIIFRPFHEMDGSWFWWGKNFCTSEEYKKLYQFTVTYLRDSLNIHNIIYAFSPDCRFNSEEEYLARYPGDEYVDVLGMDNYWDFRYLKGDLDMAYKKLMIISNYASKSNKLAALTETGQKNVEDSTWFTGKLLKALTGYAEKPKLSYVAMWRNSLNGYYTPYKGHPAEKDFIKFKENPYILFEDKLPKVYTTRLK